MMQPLPEQTLEFRGIRLEHLSIYLEQLGGVPDRTPEFPYAFRGPDWEASILHEEEVRFTASFAVNAVLIRFTARNEERLKEVVKAFRLKTFRAGG